MEILSSKRKIKPSAALSNIARIGGDATVRKKGSAGNKGARRRGRKGNLAPMSEELGFGGLEKNFSTKGETLGYAKDISNAGLRGHKTSGDAYANNELMHLLDLIS